MEQNVIQINSGITSIWGKFRCECKKHYIYEKDYVWSPRTYSFENGKYLASIMDDSMIICDEVIKSYDE